MHPKLHPHLHHNEHPHPHLHEHHHLLPHSHLHPEPLLRPQSQSPSPQPQSQSPQPQLQSPQSQPQSQSPQSQLQSPSQFEIPGRVCDSESQKFKGMCLSASNCASVCQTEGFQTGRCGGLPRKCICTKQC